MSILGGALPGRPKGRRSGPGYPFQFLDVPPSSGAHLRDFHSYPSPVAKMESVIAEKQKVGYSRTCYDLGFTPLTQHGRLP